MDMLNILAKIWPMLVGFVMLFIALAKLDNRTAVLEEKVKTLFDLFNRSLK